MKKITSLFGCTFFLLIGLQSQPNGKYGVKSSTDQIDGIDVHTYYVTKDWQPCYKVSFYAPPLTNEYYCSIYKRNDSDDGPEYTITAKYTFPEHSEVLSEKVISEKTKGSDSKVYIQVIYIRNGKRFTEEFYIHQMGKRNQLLES